MGAHRRRRDRAPGQPGAAPAGAPWAYRHDRAPPPSDVYHAAPPRQDDGIGIRDTGCHGHFLSFLQAAPAREKGRSCLVFAGPVGGPGSPPKANIQMTPVASQADDVFLRPPPNHIPEHPSADPAPRQSAQVSSFPRRRGRPPRRRPGGASLLAEAVNLAGASDSASTSCASSPLSGPIGRSAGRVAMNRHPTRPFPLPGKRRGKTRPPAACCTGGSRRQRHPGLEPRPRRARG
jgi:hypothetical protein